MNKMVTIKYVDCIFFIFKEQKKCCKQTKSTLSFKQCPPRLLNHMDVLLLTLQNCL